MKLQLSGWMPSLSMFGAAAIALQGGDKRSLVAAIGFTLAGLCGVVGNIVACYLSRKG